MCKSIENANDNENGRQTYLCCDTGKIFHKISQKFHKISRLGLFSHNATGSAGSSEARKIHAKYYFKIRALQNTRLIIPTTPKILGFGCHFVLKVLACGGTLAPEA
eukprot:g14446.t1